MQDKKTTCPLCSSDKITTFCNLNDTRIYSCKSCENAWTSPPPPNVDYTEEDFHGGQFDDADEPGKFESLPAAWRESIEMQVAMLQGALVAGASILEIGCGEGLLLKQLSTRGFDVVGIEAGQKASARARKAGLNVMTGYFGRVELNTTFDAVIVSHVLEHVADPEGFLNKVRTHHPQAKLLLVQTNYKGLIPRIQKKRWYAWAIHQHYWHFTLPGLTKLANRAGYVPDSWEHSTLCHAGRYGSILIKLSKVFPKLQDQFHLLLQPKTPVKQESVFVEE
jgi:2-polyprenyl-3-methyl-5-hydroxy-6-metoxy-1,4-benzoquinol methylase